MPLAGKPLDDRWLEFVRLTTPIAEEHPSFLSLRQQFYKLQFEHLTQVDVVERLKDFMRIALFWKSSPLPPGKFDVVFWLQSLREPEVEAILPLWRYIHMMKLRGIV